MYELGSDIGKYYSINVPLREGIDDLCEWYNTCTLLVYYEVYNVFLLFVDTLNMLLWS